MLSLFFRPKVHLDSNDLYNDLWIQFHLYSAFHLQNAFLLFVISFNG